MATVAYVAPELVTDGRADPRTDVYSAGIVLFEMLTGRVPYDGEQARRGGLAATSTRTSRRRRGSSRACPRPLDDLVARATRRDPGGRPTDAGAMLAEIQITREDLGVAAAGARAAAAPTVRVRSLDPPTQAIPVERPAWSRLPPVAPARTGAGRRRADDGGRYDSGGRYDPGRSRTRPRPTGVAGLYHRATATVQGRRAVAAAIVVVGLLVAVGGWWFGIGRYTEAPALTGLTRAAAVALAQRDGFTIATDAGQFDEHIPKDTVLGQRPGHGQRIVRGGTITLTLSKGPQRYVGTGRERQDLRRRRRRPQLAGPGTQTGRGVRRHDAGQPRHHDRPGRRYGAAAGAWRSSSR